MMIAITREVSDALAHCQLSFVARTPIDVTVAAEQHHAYQKALLSLGCRVESLPAQHALPDAVFVEDVALVFDEIAIRTRPGAPSRRDEVASVAQVLERYRPLYSIEPPGTIDGGDVLRIGRTVYVGQSARTNAAGTEQLRELLKAGGPAGEGYIVIPVTTRGCLHLKSAVTQVADDTVLINPGWVDAAVFAQFRQIEVDPSEEHAANALRIGESLIYPTSFPRTLKKLMSAGIPVSAVNVSELQKAEGAVTCCSLVFRESIRR